MATIIGVDAAGKKWIAVVLTDGRFADACTAPTIAEVAAEVPNAAVIGVDIPIGLPSSGRRAADLEAKGFVGPRRSSVFYTHPRAVIEAPTYADARAIARRFGNGISAQAYALRSKILEVDTACRNDDRLIEVHPEVSFRALSDAPLLTRKRSWDGQMQRRHLLAEVGIVLPDTLDRAGTVPVDDVLDAAVCAWTAGRYAAGTARCVPDPPEINDEGMAMAIWR